MPVNRLICAIVFLAVMLGLCACGDNKQNSKGKGDTAATANKLDEPVFDYVAYSRIDTGDKGPINSEAHLRYCASLPFTTLKADVQPTADGGLVLCHDGGFTFKDGRITSYDKENCTPIRSLTTQQCLDLEYYQMYDGEYCKVTDFETFIRICSQSGKFALITVRDAYVDEMVDAVLPILEKYHWTENSIINSFTISTLTAFRKASPEVKLSYVLQLSRPVTKMDVDTAVRLGNCIITSFHFRVSDTESGWAVVDASADGIAYAASKGVRVYQAQVAEGVDVEKLIACGYSGAQLRFVPEFTEHIDTIQK